MDFVPFGKAIHDNFVKLSKNKNLFVVGEDYHEISAAYLSFFPEGSNPIYKTRTEHDCSCCKSFLHNIGGVVALDKGKRISIWDMPESQLLTLPVHYQEVVKQMSAWVHSQPITSIFATAEPSYGKDRTIQLIPGQPPKTITHNHFSAKVPDNFFKKADVGKVKGLVNTNVQTLKRGLTELKRQALVDTLAFIADKDNPIYRGEEFKPAVKNFLETLDAYEASGKSEDFLWENAVTSHAHGFRNSAIGTLVVDLSDGVPEDKAIASYEVKVAPENYQRPKPVITAKMASEAMATLAKLGLESSLERRMAKLSDISIGNVLWVNNDSKAKMRGSIESILFQAAAKSTKPVDESNVVQLQIDEFMTKVLPDAVDMEIQLGNNHLGNLMTLTAPVHADAGQLFKWNNGLAWSYKGGITDSELRKQVAARGGSVTGAFRFSHQWNYDLRNASLMDLHVLIPGWRGKEKVGKHDEYGTPVRVGWNCRTHEPTGAVQDVDYVQPAPVGYVPVENITFPDLARMPNGNYVCAIHNWQLRSPTQGGFKAEIEFGGQVFEYERKEPMANKEWQKVATVTLKNGVFTIEHHMKPSSSQKEEWGVKTQTFTKVNTVMYSPNHWDGQATGNRHWFFILDGCKNPEPARGIYNEFLKPELEQHRRVFELLGSKTSCPVSDDQLSGVGFSSTKRDSVLVRVKGHKSSRVYNVNF